MEKLLSEIEDVTYIIGDAIRNLLGTTIIVSIWIWIIERAPPYGDSYLK